MILGSLGSRLNRAINKLLGKPTVDERAINEFLLEIQRALLEADVNVKLVLKISRRIKERALKEKLPPTVSRKDYVIKLLYDELVNLLGGKKPLFKIRGKSTKILLVGVEGSGKTTTAAKLAKYFKKRFGRVALISSDVIRPASHIQLADMVREEEIPVFWKENATAAEIIGEGLERFKNYNVILIDTAGRHKDEQGLMNELREYFEITKPDHVLLVLDATIGQAALKQAKAFKEMVPLGGAIITKLDGSAKGGGALSAVAEAGVPVYFAGVGEKIDDLERFDAGKFLSRLMGMGDLEGLIDRIDHAIEESELLEKMSSGKFDMDDFRQYVKGLERMGPLDHLISMLPGIKIPSDRILAVGEESLRKWDAIINSMTPEERRDPSLIRGARIARIARGAGATQGDVRNLLRAYNQMRAFLSGKRVPRLLRGLMKRYGM